jgi:formylglycine-generating enzyme required for sulfatase activity
MTERDIFIAALQIEARAQRQQYLDQACGGDETLRRNVAALLDAHERAGSFLQGPVFNQAEAPTFLGEAAQAKPAETAPSGTNWGEQDTQGGATNPRPPSLGFLAPPQRPDELGRLGQYRVLRLLGQGGMGMVFMAEDPQLGRSVALKMMLPEVAARPEARDRFMREARAQAQIEHDHIVPIYQVDQFNGVPFLAMPLLKGLALDDYLKRSKALSLAQVLRIGRDTARGLQAAHERGLIHRDIKPANLWLDSSAGGRVKILDFGLARAQQSGNQLTVSGTVVGTPTYMAPEQIGGKPEPRSDLYSLGVVLYRLLTGRLPFPDGDMLTVLMAVATDPVPPLGELAPHVPAGLAALVMRLLAKKPDDRPGSAHEVAEALRGVERDLAGTPSVPTPVSVPQQARPATSARRRRLMLAAALGLGGLAIGLLALALTGAFPGRHDDKAPRGHAQKGDNLNEGGQQGVAKKDGADKKQDGADKKQDGADKKAAPESGVLVVDLGKGVKMEFIRVPAGEFLMGSPNSDQDAGVDEKPQHRVKITKGFYLGKYPVTQEQYKRLMGKNPSTFSSEKALSFAQKGKNIDTRLFPVEYVTWDNAIEFCRALTRLDRQGRVFRLPTEAEWEYAARAGTTTRYFFGDETAKLPLYAWIADNAQNRTHEVGTRKPNPWGLYDMCGNVWQWCADWYGRNYYPQSDREDPKGPESGKQRVLRGSTWSQRPGIVETRVSRVASRTPGNALQHDSRIGFRVCASLEPGP